MRLSAHQINDRIHNVYYYILHDAQSFLQETEKILHEATNARQAARSVVRVTAVEHMHFSACDTR